jgi:hypothetical protein
MPQTSPGHARRHTIAIGRGTRSCRLLTGARHASPRPSRWAAARERHGAAERTARHGNDHRRGGRGHIVMQRRAARSNLHRPGPPAQAPPAGQAARRGTPHAGRGVGGAPAAARRVPTLHQSAARTGHVPRTGCRTGLIYRRGVARRGARQALVSSCSACAPRRARPTGKCTTP